MFVYSVSENDLTHFTTYCFLADTQAVMFGGSTYAQYTLLPEGVEQTRQRRQGDANSLRSFLREELSLRFRTENENGLLFRMSGSGTTGDYVSIQVSVCSS